MKVLGFDFGTTNSLISIIRGGRAINILKDGMAFPSVVCYEGSRTIVGAEAKERLGEAGLGIHGNVIRSPKHFLGEDSIHVEGVDRNPIDVVKDVVQYVYSTASDLRPDDLAGYQHAVVTIPVDMEGYRRRALRDAFRKAGLSIVQFVHEPLAALYAYFRSKEDPAAAMRQFEGKLLLVFDWGGGTLDLTLCRMTNGLLVQLVNDGTSEVGGDEFDEIIRNEVIKRALEKQENSGSISVHPDARLRLVHQCERAKIDLSNDQKALIYAPDVLIGAEDPDLDSWVTREDLEDMVEPLVKKGVERIQSILEKANVAPAQVALCLATGGMSNMPIIRTRLHEWFGAQRVEVSDRTGSLIAEGAAWIAHDRARLSLAKNVELELARCNYLPLIKAGAKMPEAGESLRSEQILYCADPRDGFAKFSLCMPLRPGNKIRRHDQRRPLETFQVQVDPKAIPFRERIEMQLTLDENLILHASATSTNEHDQDGVEVHDLEFGLGIGPNGDESEGEWDVPESESDSQRHQAGNLVLRSNITNREDYTMVPGELLYTYDRGKLDPERRPPQVLIEESLYYQPCSLCGRKYNDPNCRCGSSLGSASTQ